MVAETKCDILLFSASSAVSASKRCNNTRMSSFSWFQYRLTTFRTASSCVWRFSNCSIRCRSSASHRIRCSIRCTKGSKKLRHLPRNWVNLIVVSLPVQVFYSEIAALWCRALPMWILAQLNVARTAPFLSVAVQSQCHRPHCVLPCFFLSQANSPKSKFNKIPIPHNRIANRMKCEFYWMQITFAKSERKLCRREKNVCNGVASNICVELNGQHHTIYYIDCSFAFFLSLSLLLWHTAELSTHHLI